MEIKSGELIRNETNQNSKGGTEMMVEGLHARLDQSDMEGVQIVASRKRELDNDMLRIFWAHDLPGDPESEFLSNPENHQLFHLYVFVSNWQMQAYINRYNLPWSMCTVIMNAIEPLEFSKPADDGTIRFIYTPTPHRGLNLLVPVFEELCKGYDNIHLDVFSSFALYGWKQRDLEYYELFDRIRNHKQMTYHGTASNDDVRKALSESHIFIYPSIWPETSCLCLIEAMSAGLTCIHSNYGALYETANQLNQMYQYNEDPNHHAAILFHLTNAILQNQQLKPKKNLADYVNGMYSWDNRIRHWKMVIESMKEKVKDRSISSIDFEYST